MASADSLSPGPDLYRKVRASFVLQGTTVSGWSQRNGITRQHAYNVLTGRHNGPKAKQLRARIVEAAGIEHQGEAA